MSNTINLKDWTPGAGPTGIVLHLEFEPEKGSQGQLATMLHALPNFVQTRLNLDGSRMHADLSDLYDLVTNPAVASYSLIKCLHYQLKELYPAVFGQPEEERPHYVDEYLQYFRILEHHREGDVVTPGYHKYACAEPLILEPEDWSAEQWDVLCKLMSMNPTDTTRMVLHLNSLEVWNEPLV